MPYRLSSRSVSHLTSVIAVTCASLGCGADPVSFSAPVGISLKAKSSDTANGVISEEKGITTESGNPYGAFVTSARQALGGRDPSRIEIETVDLYLGAGSTGAATLGAVFEGTVDVVFQINDTNNSYPAASGTVSAGTSAGPAGLSPRLDTGTQPDFDYLKFLGGSFKVALRGPASATFATGNANVDLELRFTFSAFE